jgi:hypothetical protein
MSSDTASLELDDRGGQIVLPRPGSLVLISLGWEGQGMGRVFEGTVDEIRASGGRSGRTLSISAKGMDKGTDGAVTITALPRTSLLGVRRPTAADRLPAGTVVTPAKPRKAATSPSPAPVTASLVAAVQRALIDKGYHEVGDPDGKPGTKTRSAILAFEADNELDLVGKPSPELLAAILASDHRPVAETRAEGVPADNRVVKDAGVLKTIGGVLTGGSILGGVGPILEKIEGGAGMIARLRAVIEPLVDLWPLLAVAGGIAVFWYATRARAQVVEDYQSGKLAR